MSEAPVPSPAHILITGSTRGIGAAAAQALAGAGARIVRHGSRDGRGVLGADLEQSGAADALWDRALEALDGRIDVLVNNAGVFEPVPVEADADAWRGAWAR